MSDALSTDISALYAQGLAAGRAGRLDDAVACFQRLTTLRPDDPTARSNLGVALYGQRRYGEALAQHQAAYALVAPHLAGICAQIGHAQLGLDAYAAAIEQYRLALTLAPDTPGLRRHLAAALSAVGRHDEAITLLRTELRQRPNHLATWKTLLSTSLYHPKLTTERRLALHHSFNAQFPESPGPKPAPRPYGDPPRRLRLGFISSDFHDHPVAYSYELIFRHLDRSRFEVWCYALGGRADTVADRLRAGVDHWRALAENDPARIAAQLRADAVDVAILIAPRFNENQPLIAQHRPAPLVITTGDCEIGLSGVDYIIADRVMIPRPAAPPPFERPLRIPNLYVRPPLVDAPPPGPLPAPTLFIAGHNPAKLNAPLLACWSKILRRLPQARLALRYRDAYRDPQTQGFIRAALGDDVAERIEFWSGAPDRAAYLAQYHQARVALDPFPFNGATVTFEALWMGVPSVALLGENVHGRIAASFLRHIGLADCVTTTPEHYVDIAVALAGDDARLIQLRRDLRDRMAGSSLCDGPRTARWFGRAVLAAWRQRLAAAATA